ncbi:MAG: DNA topoisomerase VI subunit B [Bdellovibrionales bacterium RBG_16_40_8]|nr:MAG: DNA topoisomerase VI subunit B [Bdellovibrionales bacterium RBG_16_40_8]
MTKSSAQKNSQQKITQHSTAEYFAKNLQQVGFSSPVKAVLTTLKESVDNSLDACEEGEILPEINISVKRVGIGSAKNTDLIEIKVEDNGPGIDPEYLPTVFGEYLSSSKFGRGRCSRGQQGIGISAATTWAQLTNASGVKVISKTKAMRKAVSCQIDVDIKANKGAMKEKETIDWDRSHGTSVVFRIDGRVQLNGDGGLLTYLEGTTLVNPHLTLKYKLLDNEPVEVKRVSEIVPEIPSPTLPHPHTMKLGEFMTHAHLFGKMNLQTFLKKGFSRVSDEAIKAFVQNKLPKSFLQKPITSTSESEFKTIFQAIQATELQNPSTRSVLNVGEEALSKSIQRLGQVDFFSVVARKPKICDHKPVVVEVAVARFLAKQNLSDEQSAVQLLRFANRVPLQFDKAACAITNAVESVNWRVYGLAQAKDNLPFGPYVIAVSVVSPFIKFKNASKETIDASDDLVEEIRRALMQAGQKLSRHIKREVSAADLERKLQHIEKFGPILVEYLGKVVGAPKARVKRAEEGLTKLLGRDSKAAENKLSVAETELAALKAKQKDFNLSVEESLENQEEIVQD